MYILPNKNKILDVFSICKNWEEKYQYMIELGNMLPPLSDNMKLSKYLVPGCQSQTWIISSINNNGIIELQGDSNSLITKGMIAIVFSLYQGLTPCDILSAKIIEFLKKLDLQQNLTFSRSQGLGSIIDIIQQQTLLLNNH